MAKTRQALQAAGYTFIPPSLQEITAIFEKFYWEARHEMHPCEHRHTPSAIEVSAATPVHQVFLQEVVMHALCISPSSWQQG